MTQRTALAIVNPAAGNGAAERRWLKARAVLRASLPELEEVKTEAPGHARELARGAGTDLVLAVGGDGTVSDVAAGILEIEDESRRPALGIVATGRGNDFRKSLAVRGGVEELGRRLAVAEPKAVDAGRILFPDTKRPSAYFVNVAGAGFEPEVLKKTDSDFRSLPPAAGYLAGMLTTLLTFQNAVVDLDLDGRRLLMRANSVLVANGRYFANGMKIAPDADLTDGLFDVVIVGDMGRASLVLTYPRLYFGRHVSHPRVSVWRAKRVTLASEAALAVEADGDIRGSAPAVFEVLPKALRVIA